MVMNRDLGLKDLVDLKSKIDTMLEQGYKPSAYDLRALKSFMEGAQYNAGLDGGDPRLALVTLSINRAILGRDQVWAHHNDGQYTGGEKFETALKEFLKDEDGFWRKLRSEMPQNPVIYVGPGTKEYYESKAAFESSLTGEQKTLHDDIQKLQTDIFKLKAETWGMKDLPSQSDIIHYLSQVERLQKELKEKTEKFGSGLTPTQKDLQERAKRSEPKDTLAENAGRDMERREADYYKEHGEPRVFRLETQPYRDPFPERLKIEPLHDPLPGNEPREFLVFGPNPHYQEEMTEFYKGLSREQKALFTDKEGPFARAGALGISSEGLREANDQHAANLERFEKSLTPDQKKKWDELNHRGGGRFARPDDGIERAPDVPILTLRELRKRGLDSEEFKRILEEAGQPPQTSLSERLLEKPLSKPLETLQDYFERTSLKRVICVSGNEGDTRQMLEDAGMNMSMVAIEKGGALAADSKRAPDLETPPPAVQKNTVFTV